MLYLYDFVIDDKYSATVERLTPMLQGLYIAVRNEGFDRETAKQAIEAALKCGMINEMFGNGVDKDSNA